MKKIGFVAYELDLPPTFRIHPVFHISQLKPKLGSKVAAVTVLPPVDAERIIQSEPVEVLARCSPPRNNMPFIELLVCWAGQFAEDTTWEEFYALKEACPNLVGKVL